MSRSRSSVVQFIGAAVLVLVLGACVQEPAAPEPQPQPAQLRILAGTAGSAIAALVVTVTAPDIATPLTFTLPVQDRIVSGTITIPAGSARLITLGAYDAASVETHHGSVTVDVVAGTPTRRDRTPYNPTVAVVLEPLAGNKPIVVQVGSFTILISRQAATLSVGDTIRLRATIIDVRGATVRSSAGWATLTPGVVTVDTAGLVTAVGTGSGQIVVTFARFGAAAQIEVKEAVGVIAQPLAAGFAHTCALTRSGAAYCWGAVFRLGDGSGGSSSVPVAVEGGLSFTALAGAGWGHTCGLTGSGAAYCWGGNEYGQLGDGSNAIRSAPVAVVGGLSFRSVSTGSRHNCGLTEAGAAYCWGLNVSGQLGDGSHASSSVPVAVPGGLSFSALVVGGSHTCGLTDSGAAYCWGFNGFGELGDGSTTGSATPVAVSGGLVFSALALGHGYSVAPHTCGLTGSGAAYCWGANEEGQLGDGSTTNSATPVAVSGGLSFTALAAGGGYTCGLTASGAAYCWGSNDTGQLGIFPVTIRSSSTPIAVSGGLSFRAIAAGTFHTCGLTGSGAAYCWGFDDYGQLGDGSTSGGAIPAAVSGGLTFGAFAPDLKADVSRGTAIRP